MLSRNRKVEQALEIVAKSHAKMERIEEVFREAESHRFYGQLLLKDDSAKVEGCFNQAIKTAH